MKKLITILTLITSMNIFAGEVSNFTEEKFNKLQEENASILIDVKATWCPVCKKQEEIIKKYFEENSDSNIFVLNVDYDDQKEWVRYFKAPRQSTLVSYIGKQKVEMTIARKDEKTIFAQMKKIEK